MKYMFSVKTSEYLRGYWCEFEYPVCFDCKFGMHTKEFNSVFFSKKEEVEDWLREYSEHSVHITGFSDCKSLLVF